MTKLEEVAAAIERAYLDGPGIINDLSLARAAIAALRTMNKAMEDAGMDVPVDHTWTRTRDHDAGERLESAEPVWTAILDAILSEGG